MDRFPHRVTELPGLWVNIGKPVGLSSNIILHKMLLKVLPAAELLWLVFQDYVLKHDHHRSLPCPHLFKYSDGYLEQMKL